MSAQTQKELEVLMEKKVDITSEILTISTDVICGMDLTKHSIADTLLFEGYLYGFCSEYCKNKFEEDPKAALAKFEQETEDK